MSKWKILLTKDFKLDFINIYTYVADVLLVLIVLILFIIEIKNKIKVSRVILTGLVLVVLYFVSNYKESGNT